MNLKKSLFILLTISFFSRVDGFYIDTDNPEEVSKGTKVSRCLSCGPLWGFVLKSRGEEKSSVDSMSSLGCAFEKHGIVLPCCLCMKIKSERAHITACCVRCNVCLPDAKHVGCCCCFEGPNYCSNCSCESPTSRMDRDS